MSAKILKIMALGCGPGAQDREKQLRRSESNFKCQQAFFFLKKEPGLAMAMFKQAIELDPSNADAKRLFAQAFQRMPEVEQINQGG